MIIIRSVNCLFPNTCQTRFPQGWTARTAPGNQEQLKEFHGNLHWKGGTKTFYKIPVRTEGHCTSYGHFLSKKELKRRCQKNKNNYSDNNKKECESMFGHKNPSVKQSRCSPFQKDPCILRTSAPYSSLLVVTLDQKLRSVAFLWMVYF